LEEQALKTSSTEAKINQVIENLNSVKQELKSEHSKYFQHLSNLSLNDTKLQEISSDLRKSFMKLEGELRQSIKSEIKIFEKITNQFQTSINNFETCLDNQRKEQMKDTINDDSFKKETLIKNIPNKFNDKENSTSHNIDETTNKSNKNDSLKLYREYLKKRAHEPILHRKKSRGKSNPMHNNSSKISS